jgi:hypothetical protein
MGLAAVTLLAAPAAWAEDFATQGQVAVSAERLAGLVWSRQTTEVGESERTNKATSITLLSNRVTGLLSPYAQPRVGIDYFAIDGLSVGGAISYFTVSTSSEEDGEDDDDGATLSGFSLSPRVGYAFMFNETVGLWPRGGITYATTSTSIDDSDSETSANHLALSIEAPLVITPVEHVAFTIAPSLDLGLSGSEERPRGDETEEQDVTATDFGVQAGLLVYF